MSSDKMETVTSKWVKGNYHYEFYIEECVLCGSGKEWKERKTGPAPENRELVYHYIQFAHDSHFM